MAYIGNTVENQGFTPAIDYFSGNGVTVTFTLSRPVASVAQVIVAIDNVIQNPNDAFTVAGNAITFSSAPLSGSNNIWVEYTSLITTYQGISQDPTVIGDIRATGGYLAEGDFGNSFVDGAILDYVTGLGRITVGDADGLAIYNGGTASRTALMTVAATGNVGIGTTTPPFKLSINYGDVTGPAMVLSGGRVANGAPEILFTNSYWNSGNFGPVSIAGADNGSAGGNLIFKTTTSGSGTSGVPTERMRIDSSGNVLIGGTVPSAKLDVKQSTAGATAIYMSNTNASPGPLVFGGWTNAAPNDASVQFMLFSDSVGYRFYINANGGIANYSANNTNLSDERTKKDIVNAGNYLDKICAIPVRNFLYKDQTDTQLNLGVIAQEVESVAPELVDNSGFGDEKEGEAPLKAIYQTDLQYALMKSIQELKAIVDAQAARIAALEAK